MENINSKDPLDYFREYYKKATEKESENIYDRIRKADERLHLLRQYKSAYKEKKKREKKELVESSMNLNYDEIKTTPYPALDYRNSYEKKNN